MTYEFDRFLRYDEMVAWLRETVAAHPALATLETYGTSHEGRPLLLVAITNSATGPHQDKPAHWVDANIHSVEVTGGVAALHLIHALLTRFNGGDPRVVEALDTRTFYVAPRVNPDGVEAALADSPRYRRSSMRPWPWRNGHQWPGLEPHDVNGDGKVLTMRIADPHGAWVEHPSDARVMIPREHDDAPWGAPRYRLLVEGTIHDFDGFTVPGRRPVEGLDLNRNFPAGWSTATTGSGDHPMSEPEIDALVRAVVARPNICGYNAFHTSGGFLLRPSSVVSDSALPPEDVWMFKQLGAKGAALTTYPVYSVYEDLTWDKSDVMSGAADDWAYEHLGVFSWTTEFWDAIHRATGRHCSTDIWYVGPTVEQELAVAKWSDVHAPGSYLPWTPFEHPQLGRIEIGGADDFRIWTNAPLSHLRDEVAPHVDFALHQALQSPRLVVAHDSVTRLGDDTWRVDVGIANAGWLPTHVSVQGRKKNLTLPIAVTIDGAVPVGQPATVTAGQLAGGSHFILNGGPVSNETPDRCLVSWVVRAPAGTTVTVTASHQRAGRAAATLTLG